MLSAHSRAVLQALFVTFLWSTSWVLIKFGLADIPALTFAGLRYGLAFVCLLPFALQPKHLAGLRCLPARGWLLLLALGLLYYAITQGAQFLGLQFLPAVTVSLMLNFTTIIVAMLGVVLLREQPSRLQWAGVVCFLTGVVIYFFPVVLAGTEVIGLAVMLAGVLANAVSSVLGRSVNRSNMLHPIMITTVSMGVGAFVLLVAGVAVQGMPQLSLMNWAMIGWLAVVNTAFAFTLWNHTLRTLSAMESSIINNTMLIQIALLAWIFLDEQLTAQKIAGMVMAALGVLIVQLQRRTRT